jgi:hypothetical protein
MQLARTRAFPATTSQLNAPPKIAGTTLLVFVRDRRLSWVGLPRRIIEVSHHCCQPVVIVLSIGLWGGSPNHIAGAIASANRLR